MKHVPGKSIPASDAASRYPSLNDNGDVDLSCDPSLDILAALETRDEEDEDFALRTSNSSSLQALGQHWRR